MITDTSIQQIRDVRIIDILERYGVQFKKKKACCPFHDEKTGSLSVYDKENIFKCFGCGEAGDGIAFVQKKENLDFIGAVEHIASMFNIQLEYSKDYDKEAYKKQREEKKSLRQILQIAQDWYRNQLLIKPDPKEYLQQRGYTRDIAIRWGLGWGGDEWHQLAETFKRDGSLPQAIQLGICKESEHGRSYDFFRNRITFPIRDEFGELIGFGARVTDDSSPKYLNSPQTPLYDKSRTLYGLYEAKPHIKRLGYAILVEGYTDVISMHTGGAENTVGTCGTALTDEHCRLLKRFTNTIVLMRDNDTAGLKAIARDMELLITHGFRVEVLVAGEDGTDPDNLAKQYFPEPEKMEVESE